MKEEKNQNTTVESNSNSISAKTDKTQSNKNDLRVGVSNMNKEGKGTSELKNLQTIDTSYVLENELRDISPIRLNKIQLETRTSNSAGEKEKKDIKKVEKIQKNNKTDSKRISKISKISKTDKFMKLNYNCFNIGNNIDFSVDENEIKFSPEKIKEKDKVKFKLSHSPKNSAKKNELKERVNQKLRENRDFLDEQESEIVYRQSKLSQFSKVPPRNKLSNFLNFKIILLGNIGVGKSSLFNCYLNNEMEIEAETENDSMSKKSSFLKEDYFNLEKSTLGPKTQTKKLYLQNNTQVSLQVWDTSGEEKFRAISKQYYRDADGILLLFDLTDSKSFISLSSWLEEIRGICNKETTILLLGSKHDLKLKRQIDFRDAESFARLQKIDYVEISSINGKNIEISFEILTHCMILSLEEKLTQMKKTNKTDYQTLSTMIVNLEVNHEENLPFDENSKIRKSNINRQVYTNFYSRYKEKSKNNDSKLAVNLFDLKQKKKKKTRKTRKNK